MSPQEPRSGNRGRGCSRRCRWYSGCFRSDWRNQSRRTDPALICNVVGLYHSYGNGVKQLAIGIPVGWVFGEDFFVALDVGSHGIATVGTTWSRSFTPLTPSTPSSSTIACDIGYIPAQVARESKYGFSPLQVYTMVLASGVFDADHLLELGVFVGSQCISLFLAQRLGIFIVFLCACNQLDWLRGVGGNRSYGS